jgi:zinc finger-containing ubiquitin peptidase 1
MPAHIARLLEYEDEQNTLRGVIPKLAALLQKSDELEAAYLCTPTAVQIHKLKDEGNHFCGYRNMQMLCLALGPALQSKGGDIDMSKKLAISQLQDLIETAWDAGFNPHGRRQTGGIKGTRKHVGTSEAEALLLSLNVPCTGTAFSGKHAWRELLDFVEAYFSNPPSPSPSPSPPSASSSEVGGTRTETETKVHQTQLPPIFLQRPNHSLSIVGLEKLQSGKRRLLVFDPAWRSPSALREKSEEEMAKLTGWQAKLALAQYQKRERYLRKYRRFEALSVEFGSTAQH